jgi:hypothetical protein
MEVVMKHKYVVIALSLFSFLASLTFAQERKIAQPPPRVKVSIDGFPVSLDVLKPQSARRRSAPKYYAEGVAWVEGSEIKFGLAPGFKLPDGGLVVDANTRISKELLAALGLPQATKLVADIYKGTVYYPEQPTNPNAREIVITGGIKGGSGGWEANVGFSIKIGK